MLGRSYPAILVRVVDGDTALLIADLGFGLHLDVRGRLARINAPEMRTPDGPAAKAHLEELLRAPGPLSIECRRQDEYGRWLVELVLNGLNLNDRMVLDGYAVHVHYGLGEVERL